jgi:hypothetical protein
MMLRRVHLLAHHGDREYLRRRESLRRAAGESFLDTCPLIRVTCACRGRERPYAKAFGSPLSLCVPGSRFELAVAVACQPVVFACQPVVFAVEALPESATAHDRQHAGHRAATMMAGATITMVIPLGMGVTCFLAKTVVHAGRVPGQPGGQRHAGAPRTWS